MTLEQRLTAVQTGITAACASAQRSASDVSLIAVSKRQTSDAIRRALALRQVHFGESYAQELRDKAREIEGPSWHFIGRLQRNKIKYIAPVAYRVHALETVDQAEALAKRAPATLHCLMAVNIGREPQKSGIMPHQVLEQAKVLSTVSGIKLCGLMCLPPQKDDPDEVAPFFEELAHLAAQGRSEGLSLDELSMGMSHDYPVAVQYGATWVRVGTAIFGART